MTSQERASGESSGTTQGTPAAGNGPTGRVVTFISVRAIQYGLLFLNAVLVSRALGPVGRAHYALPIALATVSFTVAYLSIDVAANRVVARREAELSAATQVLSALGIAVATIGGLATLGLGLVAGGAVVGHTSYKVVLVAAVTVPAMTLQSLAAYVLLMLGAYIDYGVASVVGAVGQLFGTSALLVVGDLTPLSAVALVLAGYAIAGGLMVRVIVRRLGRHAIAPRIRTPVLGAILRTGFTIHPLSLAIQLGPQLDLLVVGSLVRAHQTGLYSLAVTLASSSLLASMAVAQTSVEPLTNKSESDAIAFNIRFSRESLHLGTVAAIAVAIVAYPFMRFVYGQVWVSATLPFVIITFAGVATTIENPARLLLLRIGRPAPLAILATLGVVLNVALTVWLVKTLGIIGAAVGTLVSNWLYAAGVLVMLRQYRAAVPMRELVCWPRSDELVLQIPRSIMRLGRRAFR